jgi:hypothetical protein
MDGEHGAQSVEQCRRADVGNAGEDNGRSIERWVVRMRTLNVGMPRTRDQFRDQYGNSIGEVEVARCKHLLSRAPTVSKSQHQIDEEYGE